MSSALAPHASTETDEAQQILPPLENGDQLTRAEFHRRYERMTRVKKAELVEGIVHMPSPVRINAHSKPHCDIIFWLMSYTLATPCTQVSDNGTLLLDADNELQPDAVLRIREECGGQSRVNADDYLEGAPEMVVEIAASSASYDLREKKTVYRRNGVREYLVWRVLDRALDWWELREGEYRPLPQCAPGVLESGSFPGLRLARAALLAGDLPGVAAELQRGTGAENHAAFLARLAAARQPGRAD